MAFRAQIDLREWNQSLLGLLASMRRGAEMLRAAYMTTGFRDILRHFDEEEGPDGPWLERSDFTQQLYAAINRGEFGPYYNGIPASAYHPTNRLLQLTGNLRKSLLHGGDIKTLDSHSIMVSSNVGYSGKHDLGDFIERIPPRPFMWLSETGHHQTIRAVQNLIAREAGLA